MLQLVSPLRDLKGAAESGDVDQFAALAQQIMPLLKEAEKAALLQDRDGLEAATLKLGILGVRSTPQDFLDAIVKGIGVVNALVDFFVSDPDRRTESAVIALPPFVVGDELQFLAPVTITLSIEHVVKFKGLVVGDNQQELSPSVSLQIAGRPADFAALAVRVTAIGVRQDVVQLDLVEQGLLGQVVRGPIVTQEVSTSLALQLRKEHRFDFVALERVTLADPNGGRVEYGLDGATYAIVVEAEASGVVRNFPFKVKAMIAKYGLSV
jgi:hypothetical protein